MSDIPTYFMMGGWMMYWLVLFGTMALPGMALPVVAFWTKRRFVARLGLFGLGGLAVLLLLMGVVGWQWGLSAGRAALANVPPDLKETIWLAAQAEARVCLVFGLMTAVLPAAGAMAVVPLALARSTVSESRGLSGLLLGAATAAVLVGVISWQAQAQQTLEAASRGPPPAERPSGAP